ncbi:gliding motility-associated C-terminal domain-containing protein [Vicingaceae bacterium]|nr:gliding motility-associated C-terminal domain-containing protein [Vicingaceae bacterium]
MKFIFGIIFTILIVYLSFAQSSHDEPCTAIELSVETSCNYFTTDNIAATNSTGIIAPGCANYSGQDVWFSFIVPANGIVSINSLGGTITDGGMAVYSGSCGSLNLIECDDSDSENGSMPKIVLNGLTSGDTLFIRFWEYGGGTGTFSICVATMPDCGSNLAAGNTCATATPICDLNGYCGNTSGSYTNDSWSSPCGFFGDCGLTGEFCGTIENNSFLSFEASATTISFDLWVTSSVQGYGIQLFIFQSAGACSGDVTSYGPCYNPSVVEPGAVTISAGGLTVGETYYIMIDGQAGDICDYVIGANSGFHLPVSIDPLSDTICEGEQIVLTASGGNGTYLWDANPDLNTTTGSVVIATPPTIGIHNYTVNSSTGNLLCPASSSAVVTVVNCVGCSVSATNSGPICLPGGTVDLFATNIINTSYSWTGPNGFTSLNQNPIGVTVPNSTGSYSYTVTVDSSGIICSSTTTVLVNPSTTGVLDSTICNGASFVYNGTTYDGANLSGTEIFTASNGCDSVVTVTVIESGLITGVLDSTICNGASFVYNGTTYDGTNLNGTEIFTASNGCDSIVTVTVIESGLITGVLDSTICNGASFVYNGTTYDGTNLSGTEIFTASNGCDSVVTVTVTTTSELSVRALLTDDICLGMDALLSATSSGFGIVTWYYDVNATNILDYGSPISISNLSGGSHVFFVQEVSGACFSNLDSVSFTVNEVTASINTTSFSGTSPLEVTVDGSGSIGGVNYDWNFGDGNIDSTMLASNTYLEVGNYNIELTVTDGVCEDIATIQIDVFGESDILIPNVFTPNEDGENDFFKVRGTHLESVEAQIFNRWGQEMFSWGNIDGYWDGRTLAGTESPDGTYFYMIKAIGVDGEEYFKKGGFTLIR